jgi:hypothetical protein
MVWNPACWACARVFAACSWPDHLEGLPLAFQRRVAWASLLRLPALVLVLTRIAAMPVLSNFVHLAEAKRVCKHEYVKDVLEVL